MWVQGLGRFDAERIVAIPPDMPEMNNIQTMRSAFGLLHYLPSIARFSETKGYWSLPPSPLGTCPAAWEGDR
jgi:hypothetical protein